MDLIELVTFRRQETRDELVATLGPRQLALFTSYERDTVLKEELMFAKGTPTHKPLPDGKEDWPEPEGWEAPPRMIVRGVGAKYNKQQQKPNA